MAKRKKRRFSALRFASQVITVLGAFLGLFTAALLVIYCVLGSVPDSVVYGVYGLAGAELISLAAKRIFEKKSKEDDING